MFLFFENRKLPCACVVVFVPESIASFEFLELNSDDACERRTHQRTLQRGLAQAARKQVYVVDVLVNLKKFYFIFSTTTTSTVCLEYGFLYFPVLTFF